MRDSSTIDLSRGLLSGSFRRSFWPGLALGIAFSLLASRSGFSASATPATTASEGSEVIQSVFVDDLKFGKDPFFPKSTRREAVRGPAQTPVPVFTEELNLKGLSGTLEKRLAIINNHTFEIGEEYVVRSGNAAVKVRCIEIRERSVVVNVNGVVKELRLRTKL